MRQVTLFCIRCLLFGISMIVSAYACDALFLRRCKARIPSLAGNEIYVSILKSKKKTEKKKLIIGDSTANLFFSNKADNGEFYSLSCNQAISLCGHFMLLNNFLNAGNRPEEVYVIYYPISFTNNLDLIYTYHYFLKPFYRSEYKPLMTESVMCQIKQIPFYQFSQLPLLISSAWAPDYMPKIDTGHFLPPVTLDYLEKIDSLQREYDFKLYYVPSPVATCWEDLVKGYNLDGVTNSRTRNALQLYLDNIQFLPESDFSDKLHLREPLAYKGVILEKMKEIKRLTDEL